MSSGGRSRACAANHASGARARVLGFDVIVFPYTKYFWNPYSMVLWDLVGFVGFGR